MIDDTTNEQGDDAPRTSSRRDFVKRSVVAGGAVWAAPSVLSIGPRAFAAGSPGGQGECDRLFKFKYDDDGFSCPTGSTNDGFPKCGPPDGYFDPGVECVGAGGVIPGGGTIAVQKVQINDGGPMRTGFQFTFPAGCELVAVSAKAGANENNLECDESVFIDGQTVTVRLPTRDVSYVGMVICCRE